MKFKIYIDSQNDDGSDRYSRDGDDFTGLNGLTPQEPSEELPVKETHEFKPLFNPNQTYIHIR